MVAVAEALKVRSVAATWQVWVACGIVLLVLFDLAGTLNDPDTYWHIATGQSMLASFAIPVQDPYSHTMLGEPWMVHEWLSEIIFALVYRVGGWPLVAIVPPLMLAATIVIIARSVSRHLSYPHTAILCLLAVAMALPHLLARPHVLAWPLLAWWIAELVRAVDEERTPPWSLLPLMILWANLHGSFVLGLGLLGLLAGEVTLGLWRRERRVVIPWGWVGFSVLAVLASCLTPHGFEKILFVFDLMDQGVLLKLINEWQSPDFQRLSPLQVWMFLTFAAALCLGLRLPWTRVVIVFVLLHLALRHQRHIPLVGFLAPILIANPLGPQLRALVATQLELVRTDVFARLLRPLPTAALVVATAVALSASAYAMRSIEPASKAKPDAALAAALAAGISGPVLNHYAFGGYLIYSGVPTFIDGRADLYGSQFFIDHYKAVNLTSTDSLPQLLQKHGVTWTLLSPHTPAVALLDRLQGWRRLYVDDIAVVHVSDADPGSHAMLDDGQSKPLR
jgi:hypothetical protein